MVAITKKVMPILLVALAYLIGNQLYSQEQKQAKKIINLVGKEVATDSIDAYLAAQMLNLDVPGLSLAIINDGKVVYHSVKGYADVGKGKKVTNKTIFEGASLSKPLFAYFIMGFVEEGKLDLDRPLYNYLPYEDIASDARYKKITARMVLSHTTGFPNWRTDHADNKLFLKFDPGTAYEYSGEGYQYLAKVLARILKVDDAGLEVAYQKRVAAPLNLEYTKYLQDRANMKNKAKGYRGKEAVKGDDDPRIFGAAFSIHSEALDFSKWIIALMNQEGLSKESYLELFKTEVILPEGHPQRQSGLTEWTKGFAKASLPFGSVYAHGGNNPGFSSLFVMEPETKWGLIIFTNANQSEIPLQLAQYLMQP
ncbi:beta-lactamase family protein [Maribacter sp.]|nr:beta-lactamase family protein [Maribacter sp.]